MDRSRGIPRVSVLTPNLNKAGFIGRCIESVATQEGLAEHWVIDGGSTDGSVEILRRSEASHPCLRWISEPDGGQADAINKALALSSSDIIGWLNSDDYYYPGALEEALRQFDVHPSASVIYGNVHLVDLHGEVIREFEHIEDFNQMRLVRVGNFIPQPAAFMRREAVEAIGGLNSELHWTMDWDLWLRLSGVGEVIRVPGVLACSREYSHTKTATGGTRRYLEVVRLLRRNGAPWAAPAYRRYLYGWLLAEIMRRLPARVGRRIRAARTASLARTVSSPPSHV
ncbi:MAG: glycosyltransferase [Chloroflexi bacterium]|nr:glycosyltransferase [Chloroflexota bacterium]